MIKRVKGITITPKEVNKLSADYYWSKVRAYFAMNNIPRAEVARVLGVSLATVSAYNKDASNVTMESFCKICRAYHIDGLSALEKF